jgi:hypothetical protein
MKPSHTIDPNLLDNADDFQDDFYKRFTLRPAPSPLKLTDTISKNYLFPTFYGNVTCAIAIFMCPYERAQAMLPHPRMKPVKMTRGRAAVAFSCYEYKQVLGVAPYNEIAMTIPVMIDPAFNPPLLPLISNRFKNAGYYVFSMPVTSEENRIRGVNIWGLPKVTQEIDIRQESGDCVTTAYEADGQPYFELRIPTGGAPSEFDVTSNLYTRLGDRLCQCETNFKATFKVIKHMNLLFKKNVQPERPYLTLHKTPSGKVLQELQIEPHPFQLRYAEHMNSCFDLPREEYQAPFGFGDPER